MEEIDEKICYIKKEFLIDRSVEEKNETPAEEPATKKAKLDDDKWSKNGRKDKRRGLNKSRPRFRQDPSEKLCRSVLNGVPEEKDKCTHERCKWNHDLDDFFKSRPADLGDTCYIYSTKGFCKFGVSCRYGMSHLDSMKNLGTPPADNKSPIEKSIEGQVLHELRRKKYTFERGDEILKKSEGATSDEDKIPLTSRERTTPSFKDKLYLSPLTTVGNLPFRRICKEFGVDITCGEMACSVPLLNGHGSEWALTKRHESEDFFGIQICGHNHKPVTYATQVLVENASFDFIDLNIGCPIDLIFKQGAGSALLRRPNILEQIIRCCSTLLEQEGKVFTVKTRTGIYADKNVAHEFIPKFEEWGAKLVTLHGRSREQRYTKLADYEYIEQAAQTAKEIPIFGNGDIMSFEDYQAARKAAPSISGIMVGRGALIKPWIFKEIKDEKPWDPSSSERFEIMKKYVNYGLQHWGSDTKGVENTRKFLLEWQSFLYRYVPYGLLERPPQRINQRPDTFRGRDDLETLMASPNSKDWVKLSELLLGPVPDGFEFLPKHKANSY